MFQENQTEYLIDENVFQQTLAKLVYDFCNSFTFNPNSVRFEDNYYYVSINNEIVRLGPLVFNEDIHETIWKILNLISAANDQLPIQWDVVDISGDSIGTREIHFDLFKFLNLTNTRIEDYITEEFKQTYFDILDQYMGTQYLYEPQLSNDILNNVYNFHIDKLAQIGEKYMGGDEFVFDCIYQIFKSIPLTHPDIGSNIHSRDIVEWGWY